MAKALSRWIGLCLAAVVLCFSLVSPVKAQSGVEQVTSFHSDVNFESNADIHIHETITYYFPAPRHGIYRTIPTDYRAFSLFHRSTELTLNRVEYYANDNPHRLYNSYTKSRNLGGVEIKIGDPDTTVTGLYTYDLDYTLRYAVNYFSDHDELYLNVTGDQWDVPIAKSDATIHLPAATTDKICYVGRTGTQEQHCTWHQANEQTLAVIADQSLPSGEGLTVAVSMAKGSVANTTSQQLLLAIIANLGCLLPFPIGLAAFVSWWRWGRDPQAKTIIPLYHAPKDLSPLAAGFIYSQSSDNTYLSAEIIQLAIQGYIKINQLGNREYEFVRRGQDASLLLDYQQKLLEGLFKKGSTVNSKKDLKDNFFNTVREVQLTVRNRLKSDNLFEQSSENKKIIMLVVGFLFALCGFASLLLTIPAAYVAWSVGAIVSALIVVGFGLVMTKRSEQGNERYTELLGVKMYIKTAEQHRIEFHNNPKKAIKTFEELLPYAMVFGLEKQWAKEFEELYTEQPDWYTGNYHTFNAYYLSQSLGNMTSTMRTVSSPPAASGGSGFSGGGGGGFGGGGGGSW